MAHQRIHCYAASFGNDLAKDLIIKYGIPGGTVLDPFVGSGTTLVEALSAGHSAIGIDVDPIACLISRTQVRIYTLDWLVRFEKSVLDHLQELEHTLCESPINQDTIVSGASFTINGLVTRIPERSEIDFWFSPIQRLVLASLIAYMKTLENEYELDIFAISISSSIVRKWPNTISQAMDIDHSRPHRSKHEYTTISQYFILFRRVFHTTIKILMDSVHNAENWISEGTVIEGNCDEEMMSIEPKSVDLILTSPPYVNAIDYPRSHKFSEWWLSPETSLCNSSRYIGLRGIDQDSGLINNAYKLAPNCMKDMAWLKEKRLNPKSGKVYRYITDMDKVINGCEYVLKANGRLIFVLADNRINGNVVPVVRIVMEMLGTHGFREVISEQRKIQQSRRRYPFSFKGVMDTETIITALK